MTQDLIPRKWAILFKDKPNWTELWDSRGVARRRLKMLKAHSPSINARVVRVTINAESKTP